jgi:tetratricopeptide (TPR) repeat protein
MKRIAIYILTTIWLTTAAAFAMTATDYFNLGLKSAHANKKIEYFTKALELNPNLAAAYEKRGIFYYFQEKYDKVIQDFENYVKIVPQEAEPFRMLGMGYQKKGLNQAAIDSFTQAIQIDPNLASAYTDRAETYRLSGMYNEAIQDSTKAIKLLGDARIMSDAYQTRAMAYREIGQDELAEADLEKSYDLDPRVLLPMGCLYRDFTKYFTPEHTSTMGFLIIIGIVFILIFGIKLRAPRKN